MEIWKDIEGYEGIYQVSSEGRVRSLDRIITAVYKSGKIVNKKAKGKILSTFKVNKYYNVATFSGGVKKLVHRLVAETFIQNPDNKPIVDHIIPVSNGGTDNVKNLRWSTPPENNSNKHTLINMSNAMKGKPSPMKGKLNRKDVSKKVYQYSLSGELINVFESVMDVKRKLGFDVGNISKCCNGKQKTYKGFMWSYTPL